MHKEINGAEKPFPDTLRGCVEMVQLNIDKAYGLLDPNISILPEEIEDARQSLKSAQGVIEHLEELLPKSPPLPEHERIIDEVRIITDQIKHRLIPGLKPSKPPGKGFQKRFGSLLSALKKLNTLIPE